MRSNLVPWSPALNQPFEMLRRGVSDLFDQAVGAEDGWNMSTAFRPSTSLAETEDAYEVRMELAGLKTEDIDIELHGSELWITGEKKVEQSEGDQNFHYTESQYLSHLIPTEPHCRSAGMLRSGGSGVFALPDLYWRNVGNAALIAPLLPQPAFKKTGRIQV